MTFINSYKNWPFLTAVSKSSDLLQVVFVCGEQASPRRELFFKICTALSSSSNAWLGNRRGTIKTLKDTVPRWDLLWHITETTIIWTHQNSYETVPQQKNGYTTLPNWIRHLVVSFLTDTYNCYAVGFTRGPEYSRNPLSTNSRGRTVLNRAFQQDQHRHQDLARKKAHRALYSYYRNVLLVFSWFSFNSILGGLPHFFFHTAAIPRFFVVVFAEFVAS